MVNRGQSHIFLAGHEFADAELTHIGLGWRFSQTGTTNVTLHKPPANAPIFVWRGHRELQDRRGNDPFVAKLYPERHGEKLGTLEVTGNRSYEQYMDVIVMSELILLEREEHRRENQVCTFI